MFKIKNLTILPIVLASCVFALAKSTCQSDVKLEEENAYAEKTRNEVLKKQYPVPQASTAVNDSEKHFQDADYEIFSEYNQEDYFENLYAYSANNNIGSCGFVSLIQAMSYYDTFVNDDVIPESYDKHSNDATSWEEASLSSPGVLNNAYNSSTDGTYYSYCNNAVGDFQSALTVAYNIYYGTNNNGTYIDDKGNTVANFKYSIGAWDYQSTLNQFYENESPITIHTFADKTQQQYIDYIKSSIDDGNPVIVHIQKVDSNGETSGHHSVVAYDYDSSGIYANFGWGSTHTRDLLLGGTNGYDEIYYAATISVNSTAHNHSNNYVVNNSGYCGCNISDTAILSNGGKHSNIAPTFYWMKNQYDPNETFRVGIKHHSYLSTYEDVFLTSSNSFTMSMNTWKTIITEYWVEYYIEIERISDSIEYEPVITHFGSPDINTSAQHITIAPTEYDFEERYYFDEKTLDVTQGDYTFTTVRKRCGYIRNQNINLSANREGAGEAYIEYHFDFDVQRIDVDLSYWDSQEGFNSATNKATAQLDYLDENGNWVKLVDLLNDIDMSDNRFFMDTFTYCFPFKTNGFRLYSTFSNPSGDTNSGRICIGDLSVYFIDEN